MSQGAVIEPQSVARCEQAQKRLLKRTKTLVEETQFQEDSSLLFNGFMALLRCFSRPSPLRNTYSLERFLVLEDHSTRLLSAGTECNLS